MATTPVDYQYYPALSDLIDVDDLPEILSFIKGGIEVVFSSIYYKDYPLLARVCSAKAKRGGVLVTTPTH